MGYAEENKRLNTQKDEIIKSIIGSLKAREVSETPDLVLRLQQENAELRNALERITEENLKLRNAIKNREKIAERVGRPIETSPTYVTSIPSSVSKPAGMGSPVIGTSLGSIFNNMNIDTFNEDSEEAYEIEENESLIESTEGEFVSEVDEPKSKEVTLPKYTHMEDSISVTVKGKEYTYFWKGRLFKLTNVKEGIETFENVFNIEKSGSTIRMITVESEKPFEKAEDFREFADAYASIDKINNSNLLRHGILNVYSIVQSAEVDRFNKVLKEFKGLFSERNMEIYNDIVRTSIIYERMCSGVSKDYLYTKYMLTGDFLYNALKMWEGSFTLDAKCNVAIYKKYLHTDALVKLYSAYRAENDPAIKEIYNSGTSLVSQVSKLYKLYTDGMSSSSLYKGIQHMKVIDSFREKLCKVGLANMNGQVFSTDRYLLSAPDTDELGNTRMVYDRFKLDIKKNLPTEKIIEKYRMTAVYVLRHININKTYNKLISD